jgi:hypothetical protein
MPSIVRRAGITMAAAGIALLALAGETATAASASVSPDPGNPISNQICTYRLLGNDAFDTGTAVYQLFGGDEMSGHPQVKDSTERWWMYSFRIGKSGWIRWEVLQLEYCNPT